MKKPKKTKLDQKIDAFQDKIEIDRQLYRKQQLAKKRKTLSKAKEILQQKNEIQAEIDAFCKKRTVPISKQENLRLVPEYRWTRVTMALRERYVTLSGFCEHYGFTEEDFEDVFGLQDNQNSEKILNSLLKEEVIKKSDILKYWNTVSPDSDAKVEKFKTVLKTEIKRKNQ